MKKIELEKKLSEDLARTKRNNPNISYVDCLKNVISVFNPTTESHKRITRRFFEKAHQECLLLDEINKS